MIKINCSLLLYSLNLSKQTKSNLLFIKIKLVFLLLFCCVKLISQELNKDDFNAVLNSKNSFNLIQTKVDSIIRLVDLSDVDKSYVYHTYARYLYKKNKKKDSYSFLNKAIELRKINQINDLTSLKKSLFNLGLYYKRSGLYIKSIEVYKELISLAVEDRLQIKTYSELITLYSKIGDFEKSKIFFEKSTNYYVKNKDYKNLYKNYMRMSRLYASLGYKFNSTKIINYLVKADSLRKFTQIDVKDDAIINLRLGNVYEKTDQKSKAIYHYNKALGFNKKLNDSVSISILNNNIGDLYLNDLSFEKANLSLQKSVLFAGDLKKNKALPYSTYGAYYLELKEFELAKKYFESAIQLLIEGNEGDDYLNPTIEQLSVKPNKLRFFEFIFQKAIYWQKRFEVEKNEVYLYNALNDYKLADQLLDVIRFDSSENISKLFWREKGASLYIKAVEVCYLLNDTNNAYYFMEKNKALLLLEELSDQQAQVVSNLPQQLIERDFSFKQQIIEIEEKGTENNDELFELKRHYEQFKDSLSTNYPAYSKLRKTLPILSKQNHSNQLINDTTVSVQFIIHEDNAYGLAITKHKSFLYPIANKESLQKEVEKLIAQLQQPFSRNEDVEEYSKNASSIFKRLIPDDVYEKIKEKKIIIAADGILQNIPFEALLSNAEDHSSYFIKTNEISYVYSFSYLLSNAKKKRNPEHTFLGFAPQTFKDESLAVLSNSVKEVSSINSIFSDTVFIKENATKENFKSNFENYKIVHLATHSGSSNTEKPWLAFNDEKVNLNEIYGTQNQADLVVLSACKTLQGKLRTGEGVMSLARGFFFSGTNSVISTLWNINDKTTQELMYSFYTNLKKGQTKSKALHESKLAYLSAHEGSMASPFYWSSFVLIGDANVITIANGFNWTLPIVLLIIVSILIIGVSLRKKFRK